MTITRTPEEAQSQIVNMVRDFVRRDVEPVAAKHDEEDTPPLELIEKMKGMGLFGITVPEEYGGMGLDYSTFAMIFEELSKGWMSISGVIGTHHIMSYVVNNYGTEEQKQRFLPSMASGKMRGGLALTEPNAGSDVQSIQTVAVKDGEEYVINGSKMFITNAEHGDTFALMTKTDPNCVAPAPGHELFHSPQRPGVRSRPATSRSWATGALDTCEITIRDFRVPADNLVGGQEGRGFQQVMSGLETGRINIAARAVGVATAAFEHAIRYAQQREAFGVPIAQHQAIQLKLADMATKIEAARLLTYKAAEKKDQGERVDLEAGMAKLYASEICYEVAMDSMRIHGGIGYIKELPVERFYRDAPLMIIGEGTNEIQRLVIARNLLRRYAS